MSAIYLTIALAALATLATLLVLWLAKRRKQRRTQQRLLVGRRHLLDEEINLRQQELAAIDEGAINALRRDAEDGLNQLNIAVVERQAHLLNYADLTHLQQCKTDLLNVREPTSSPPPIDDRPSQRTKTATGPPPPRQSPEEQPKDRAQVENQLLGKINQLNREQNPRRRK